MMGDHGMMERMNGFGGLMSFMGIIWLIMILLIVIGGISLIVYIVRNNQKRRDWPTSNRALSILKERFARGEIEEDEYLAKKEVLERESRQ